MNDPRAQLAAALDALVIRSPTSYSWLGQVFEGKHDADLARGGGWLAHHLHLRLYADFYLTGHPAPASAPLSWRVDLARGADAARLSSANAGRGAPETGWRVVRPDGHELVVRRDGLDVWAPRSAILGGTEPREGAEVTVVLPKERVGPDDAFYTVLGDAGAGAQDGGVDRFYWHLRPAGAALLVSALSQLLNHTGLAFRLKVVNDPNAFRRCDAGVLYTQRVDRPRVLGLLGALHDRTRDAMRHAVPALTLRLAPGLAFAEDPGDGESYGSHRCRVIASGAIASWRAAARGPASRLAWVERAFEERGLDLGAPFLGPLSRPDPALAAAVA